MIRLTNEELNRLIDEDNPYYDLTSFGIGLKGEAAISFYPKNSSCTLSGIDETANICKLLDLDIKKKSAWASEIKKGEIFFTATGEAKNIHIAWKVCQNILEYSCGIASFTKQMVDQLKKINPKAEVLTTRKIFPGTKKLALNAVLAGGGLPHRLGLSDSILVFKAHKNLCKNFQEDFINLKSRQKEHKIIIEAENIDEAMSGVALGADVIQCERFTPENLQLLINTIKKDNPNILISATGGINLENISQYAKAGVDMVVTSKPYHAAPMDIKTEITSI